MALNVSGLAALNAQATASSSALEDLMKNTDASKTPGLAAIATIQSSALESMRKATDKASEAMTGRA